MKATVCCWPIILSEEARDRLSIIERTQNGLLLAEEDLKLRGPGEVFGTRQSGLPDLKVAQIGDVAMLERTRQEAMRILADDPHLERPEHRALSALVDRVWQQGGDLAKRRRAYPSESTTADIRPRGSRSACYCRNSGLWCSCTTWTASIPRSLRRVQLVEAAIGHKHALGRTDVQRFASGDVDAGIRLQHADGVRARDGVEIRAQRQEVDRLLARTSSW